MLNPKHGKRDYLLAIAAQLASLLKVCLPPRLISSVIYQGPQTQWVKNSTRYLTSANCTSMNPTLFQEHSKMPWLKKIKHLAHVSVILKDF